MIAKQLIVNGGHACVKYAEKKTTFLAPFMPFPPKLEREKQGGSNQIIFRLKELSLPKV